MDESTMEQRLRTAVEHAAPDNLERILASCTEKKGTVIPMTPPKKKRRWIPAAMAAALVIVCGLSFGAHRWQSDHTVDSIVTLDVNPSVSLDVNARERVLSVTPLNQDATVILGDMDLTGTDLTVAVNALIGSMVQNGYLDELQNSILVTVENDDAARSDLLRQQISDTISGTFQADQLDGAVLTQTVTASAELTALAQQYGISEGKAALIQDVITQDSTLTFASLAPLSVNEIALIAQSRNLTTSSVSQTGSASDKAYITADEARAAAYAHAGVSAGDVAWCETEFDSEDGVMVYELEFTVGGVEYEYDIDARTGTVVKYSREGGWSGSNGSGGTTTGTTTGTATGTTTGGTGTGIGADKAAQTALADAGFTASQVTGLQTKQDWDDGRLHYEVEFRSGGVEYDYELAADGTILKADRDTDGNVPASTGASLSEEEAKAAAFRHAGVSASQVSGLKVQRDRDDGQELYEIEFRVGAAEYEYEIRTDGTILKAERDIDD